MIVQHRSPYGFADRAGRVSATRSRNVFDTHEVSLVIGDDPLIGAKTCGYSQIWLIGRPSSTGSNAWRLRSECLGSLVPRKAKRSAEGRRRLPPAPSQAGLKITPDSEPVAGGRPISKSEGLSVRPAKFSAKQRS